MPHHEVLLRLDAMDLDRGLKLTGILSYQVLRTLYQGPRLQVIAATSLQMMVSTLTKPLSCMLSTSSAKEDTRKSNLHSSSTKTSWQRPHNLTSSMKSCIRRVEDDRLCHSKLMVPSYLGHCQRRREISHRDLGTAHISVSPRRVVRGP